MTKKLKSTKILIWAKKIKAIELLGGKCEICGDDNIFHLCFHHKNSHEKEYNIQDIIDSRWTIVEKEIKKCQLLCKNCHNELHYKENSETNKSINKKIYLEYKNTFKCEKCGYENYNGSLEFHHKNPKNKLFKISTCGGYHFKSVEDIKKHIIEELNKCDVICANCHNELHINKIFFDKNKKEIYEKVKNIRENSKKIDREKVKKLYLDGNTQKDICYVLKCKKSTISGIIKELNLNINKKIL